MNHATIVSDIDFQTAATDPRLFGSFVEHMGAVVYNGIYEPGHPAADGRGFRGDVLRFVRDLNLTAVRYPGGNFTSGYHWEDTIGPVSERPVRLDLAWQAVEPNSFGLHEFIEWAEEARVDPIMTINLGTEGVDEARDIVEYCNFGGGTRYSDLRRKNGRPEPFGIKLWCLGNELDGSWQIAARSAEEYGQVAREAAKVMKLVDPTIELVAVGSSARHLATYPTWDLEVLRQTYEHVDYLSLHTYINKKTDDTPLYLARPIDMGRQIAEVAAACDFVKAEKRSAKTVYLSFDEWNVHKDPELPYEKWTTGSPIDWCRYTMEDVLVFGSMLLNILRNADRIKISCQSLLVNTIPLILTRPGGPAWRNATYYPLLHASLYGRGRVLSLATDGPTYSAGPYDAVPVVDCVAVHDEAARCVSLFCVNRSDAAVQVAFVCRGVSFERDYWKIVMAHFDLGARNTEEAPDTVAPETREERLGGEPDERAVFELDPYSWNVIRLRLA